MGLPGPLSSFSDVFVLVFPVFEVERNSWRQGYRLRTLELAAVFSFSKNLFSCSTIQRQGSWFFLLKYGKNFGIVFDSLVNVP